MTDKNYQTLINQTWLPFLNEFFQKLDRRVLHEKPDSLRRELSDVLSLEGTDHQQGLTDILSAIVQHTPNVWSPTYLNYLYTSPDPVGLLGDWFVSLLNTNIHAYEASPALTLAEIELIKALSQTIGYDEDSDGVFCPGGSYSNMYAMYLARKRAFSGKDAPTGRNPVVFTSQSSHYSIDTACSLLGIHPDNLRRIACDTKGRMLPELLADEIRKALSSGKEPFFVNATLGTTVLGAFDPVGTICEIASEYGLWVHVDAAWGGASFFSEQRRNMYCGIEKADSVTWDLHKAMKSPILCSALLVREGTHLLAPFDTDSSYLIHNAEDNEGLDIGMKTPQCGRRADAFKFWLMWKVHGKKAFTLQVEKRFQKTEELIHAVKERDCFRLYDEFPDYWNTCFWYVPKHFRHINDIGLCSAEAKNALDKLTVALYQCLQKDAQVMVNYARIKDCPAFLRLITGDSMDRHNISTILDVIESIGNLLSQDLSQILVSGGDSRLLLDDQEQNYIMISPTPAPEKLISRSSCTGSFISEQNYVDLEHQLNDLRSAQVSFRESMDKIHNRIRGILNLDSHTSIITIPSGTESEYIPLLIAKATSGYHSKIVNIITAVEEVGSQSPTAAAGLYFTSLAPNQSRVKSGEKMGGISENIEVVSISSQSFSDQESGECDQWRKTAMKYLAQSGTLVLLHVVDSSKIGRRMDIVDEVEDLRARFPRRILVVIDSCQSRTDAFRTRHYLELGYMVMITGSKFEEGPPFSGAVLVPTALTDPLNGRSFNSLLSGLGDYITRYDVSGDIGVMIQQHLPAWMNFGLLMRWFCALNNWEKFRNIEGERRISLIQQWVEGVIQLIQQHPNIELYAGGERQTGAVGEVNTIISFKLLSDNKPLKKAALRKVYLWLNRDMSNVLPSDAQAGLASSTLNRRFLIGQPVDLGEFAVLRIALGATLACQLDQYGLESVLNEDRALLEKLNLLVTHFSSFDISPGL